MVVICGILVVVCAVEALYIVVCLGASRETEAEVRALSTKVLELESFIQGVYANVVEFEEDIVVALLAKKE